MACACVVGLVVAAWLDAMEERVERSSGTSAEGESGEEKEYEQLESPLKGFEDAEPDPSGVGAEVPAVRKALGESEGLMNWAMGDEAGGVEGAVLRKSV